MQAKDKKSITTVMQAKIGWKTLILATRKSKITCSWFGYHQLFSFYCPKQITSLDSFVCTGMDVQKSMQIKESSAVICFETMKKSQLALGCIAT